MKNLTHKWKQLGYFPPESEHFFPIFKKGQGKASPTTPTSCAPDKKFVPKKLKNVDFLLVFSYMPWTNKDSQPTNNKSECRKRKWSDSSHSKTSTVQQDPEGVIQVNNF